MIYLDLPAGGRHGWGVVGDNLASALGELAPVERLADNVDALPAHPGPLLQAVTRPHLRPRRSPRGYTRHVGYAVFEHDLEARRSAAGTETIYDSLIAASDWAARALMEGGLKRVSIIHHGVDTTRFNTRVSESRPPADDRFVVFSGGKFELRKAQDVVVRAFRFFAQRHSDAVLVAAWHNPWPRQFATMAASPYCPFRGLQGGTLGDAIRHWLSEAGLDPERVELIPPLPNADLAAVYARSDVGLFPNRCEGSTNLVMMEYMACGRPVVATDFSGHRDVLSDANSLPVRCWTLRPINRDGRLVACWCEPDIEEIVERLEWAYQNRPKLTRLGVQAADDLSSWTWGRAARDFLSHLSTA
jgi:glycosyltransferase involved in cell wall biosynthesis